LKRAPWWTVPRLRALLGTLLIVVLIVFAWSATLGRRVARQREAILQHQERQRSLEEQLQRAQKLEAIGRLAGGVAHDFNNLLTIVKGQAELLRYQVPTNSPMAERLRRIEEASQRGATLTRQLLAFGRQQRLQPLSIDLNQLLPELKSMLQSLLGDEIEVRLQLRSRLPPIWADPMQLEQVILNLAVNARDAMPQGGHLTVVTDMRPLPARLLNGNLPQAVPWVELRVSDTGHGMDEATLTRIFEPFFTTKDPLQGTGLGLATAYGIVEQCGGKIDVISKPNQGASFSLFFPPYAPDELGIDGRAASSSVS
ncbi:MAG: sensor histidine kinase, partial [Terriglobales bacterium]